MSSLNSLNNTTADAQSDSDSLEKHSDSLEKHPQFERIDELYTIGNDSRVLCIGYRAKYYFVASRSGALQVMTPEEYTAATQHSE